MSRPRARAPASRRFAVVCFGLSRERVHKQPWHVADGLAQGLVGLGHEVLVVTDAADPPTARGYETAIVERMFEGAALSPAIAAIMQRFAPERVFLLLGAVRLARLGRLGLGVPTSLVMGSPRLARAEVLRLPLPSLWRERHWLALPLLDAVVPGRTLAAGLRRSGVDDIVYLSDAAQRRYIAAGLPAGRRLVPQVSMIAPPVPAAFGVPTVAYLGPALDARGAVLALWAFERAVADGLDARLLMLLRDDAPPSSTRRMVRRCRLSPAHDRIACETARLDPVALRRRLTEVTVYLLPFRVPISEVPLVLIEAGLSGRPVIALDAPGVSEIVRRFDGLIVSDSAGLPAALAEACRRAPTSPVDPSPWTCWEGAVGAMLEQTPAAPEAAMVALMGVDGSGKTCLAAALARQLALAGTPHRRVWSRFRNYTSRPLLALTRLTGHNRKEVVAGTRVGYHDFAASPVLAWAFLLLQLVDTLIDIRLRFRGRRGMILADRCALDTLVDLAVDTGLDELVLDRWAPFVARRLPQPCLAVLIERPAGLVALQRPDALADRHFARRRLLYRRLASRLGLPVIHNDGTLEQALEALATRVFPVPPVCRDVR